MMYVVRHFLFLAFGLINGLARYILPVVGIRYNEFSMVTFLIISCVVTVAGVRWTWRLEARSR